MISYAGNLRHDCLDKEGWMDDFLELIPYLAPLIVIQIGLLVYGLIDLIKRERTKGPKWVWGIVVIFFSIIGPLVYLLYGREE